jgi:ribosomal protein S18 acetylase RimI-like enzyme
MLLTVRFGYTALMTKSLGYRTDLALRGFEGEILEREDYTVIKTQKNPSYRWGNFLLFKRPPTSADLEPWQAAFDLEHPDAQHVALGWDDPEHSGDVSGFVTAGFKFEESTVMTTQTVHTPPKHNLECQIRPLKPHDWAQWIDLECAVNAALPEAERESTDGYRLFVERKAAELGRMIAAKHGNFWGAFFGGRLAASLGLFLWGDVGRFQWVATHPEFRRRGLCGTLVYAVAQHGLSTAKTLVMVADPEYVAAGIYESVGFGRSEKQFQLEKVAR